MKIHQINLSVAVLVVVCHHAVLSKRVYARTSEPKCVVDGVSYVDGQPIMDPHHPCKTCHCDVHVEEDNGRVCYTAMCGVVWCPGGHSPVTNPRDCCPSCPDTNTCIYNGVEYEAGELIEINDPCAECPCDPTYPNPMCNFVC